MLSTLLLHTGERAWGVCSGAAVRALLNRGWREHWRLLQKQEGLDGIPLLLGHGLQLGLGPGRNGHGGYTILAAGWGAQF